MSLNITTQLYDIHYPFICVDFFIFYLCIFDVHTDHIPHGELVHLIIKTHLNSFFNLLRLFLSSIF